MRDGRRRAEVELTTTMGMGRRISSEMERKPMIYGTLVQSETLRDKPPSDVPILKG